MRFLFVDRIVHSSPGQWIAGIKHITREDAYLTRDEQGRTCFISSLIGETLGQLAAWNVMQYTEFTVRPVAGLVDSVQWHRPAYLGETLLLESTIEKLDDQAVQYHSLARIGEEPIFSIEGALGPLLPMEDFIKEDVVKKQFAAIYRPGEWAAFLAKYANATSIEREKNLNTRTLSLQFDRILESEAGVSLLAKKRVTQAAPYFLDHFPNKPVLPMTVLLECKLNLAKEFVARAGFAMSYQVHTLRKIKMNDFVLPGDVVLCWVKVKQKTDEELILSYRSEVDGKRVCVLEVVLCKKDE